MSLLRTVAVLGGLAACCPASGQQITVKSESTSKAGSSFLRPPGQGDDPYAPSVDWSRIPPWRQVSFFDIRAQGKTFVYVVDCSGSMGDRERLIRAKRELRRSIGEMRFPQRFHVIFYNDVPLPMPGGLLSSADTASRDQLARWLNLISADGATDPRGAMSQALSLKPDAVFLLSDGQFPEGTVEALGQKNAAKIPVHCVDMSGNSTDLRKIAKASGGQYIARP